jgi:hypothetical protein
VPNAWTCKAIAQAAINNPRDMETLLVAVRGSVLGGQAYVTSSGEYDFETALRWLVLTEDGLNKLAQDYLCLPLVTPAGGRPSTTRSPASGSRRRSSSRPPATPVRGPVPLLRGRNRATSVFYSCTEGDRTALRLRPPSPQSLAQARVTTGDRG